MSVKAASQPLDWKPVGTIAVALALAFGATLFEFSRQLWMKDHYSFFPLFLGALLFICYRRWQDDGPFRAGHSVSNALKMVLPVALLAGSIWLLRPWLGAVGSVFAIRALLYLIGGKNYFASVRLAWFSLWICIPPPFNLDIGLITYLQQMASETASQILDWFGYRHLLTGVLLNFPKHTFEVEKACSGIHSFFASLAGVAVYSVVLRRGLLRTLVLLGTAVFWVLAWNITRIVLVVVAEVDYQIPLASGVAHQIAGYLIFVLVVLCVVSSDRLFMYLLPQRSAFDKTSKEKAKTVLTKLEARKLPAQRLAIACVIVGVALAGFKLVRSQREEISLRVSGTRLMIGEDALPQELTGWQQTAFEVIERDPGDINGEVSYKWTYEKNGITSTIAVDGPFGAWHDLAYCYAVAGWRITKAVDDDLDLPGENIIASEIQMEDKAGQYGHVVFAVLGRDGESESPPAVRISATSGARLQGGLMDWLAPRDSGSEDALFCIQALSTVPLGFSQEERGSHKQLLTMAVSHLKGQFEEVVSISPSSPGAAE
ncbi:MAG: exosortase U [Planctomycetaceae bacterium]